MSMPEKSFDCVIVGGGIIGLAIAWRTSQLGLSVAMLERDHPARSASWVAAGMLAPVTEVSYGEEELLAFNLEAAARYPSFVQELSRSSGIPLELSKNGTLFVAFDRDQKEALEVLFEFQSSLGLDAEWIGDGRLRELEPGLRSSARAAVLARNDRAIDPRVLTGALLEAAQREGTLIFPETEVTSISIQGSNCTGVRTASGDEFKTTNVVVAAGSWSGSIEGMPAEIRENLRPVKGQLMHLKPGGGLSGPVEHIIRTEEIYLVPRADGSIVAGASVEEKGFDTTITAGEIYELLRSADEAVPGIREMELAATISGLRPGTPDNRPLIGPTSIQGLVVATGHFRNGILQTAVTADAVARFVVKGEALPEMKPFHPERFAVAT